MRRLRALYLSVRRERTTHTHTHTPLCAFHRRSPYYSKTTHTPMPCRIMGMFRRAISAIASCVFPETRVCVFPSSIDNVGDGVVVKSCSAMTTTNTTVATSASSPFWTQSVLNCDGYYGSSQPRPWYSLLTDPEPGLHGVVSPTAACHGRQTATGVVLTLPLRRPQRVALSSIAQYHHPFDPPPPLHQLDCCRSFYNDDTAPGVGSDIV